MFPWYQIIQMVMNGITIIFFTAVKNKDEQWNISVLVELVKHKRKMKCMVTVYDDK